MTTPIDFVFCSGYFLEKVMVILLCILIRLRSYPFGFSMQMCLYMLQDEDIYTFFESKILSSKLSHETRSKSSSCNNSRKKKKISMNVLDLKKENYFSAAIGQARTKARYVIDSSLDVVDLLHKLAVADTTILTHFLIANYMSLAMTMKMQI